jgi:hypothetical protein
MAPDVVVVRLANLRRGSVIDDLGDSGHGRLLSDLLDNLPGGKLDSGPEGP